MKPVAVRPLADNDVDAHADRIARDNLSAALQFLDAVQANYDRIGDNPQIGASRYAHLLEGLRVWGVPNFENYLVFYIEHSSYIDIIRVLHGARDIPVILQESGS
jgi:toxin ParE1/3/4